MPIIHYCNTNYNVSPICDLNPLLFERYKRHTFLVICAREGMVTRIQGREHEITTFMQSITATGWWNLMDNNHVDDEGNIDREFLAGFDVVVIVGKDRIDERYKSIVESVEKLCSKFRPTT